MNGFGIISDEIEGWASFCWIVVLAKAAAGRFALPANGSTLLG